MPERETEEGATWPETAFRTPLLRGLDQRGREELQRFGKLHRLEPGAVLFRPGETSDALYVVVEGTLERRARKRGDEHESSLGSVEQEGIVGAEALVSGGSRQSRVLSQGRSLVAEVPQHLLERALSRAGDASALARELRQLRREALGQLLLTSAFARDLSSTDLDLLLDAVHYAKYNSGQLVYSAGQPAEHCLFLQEGLLQIQSERDGRVRVHGYLSPGDFFGDEELLSGGAHAYSTVALGDSLCIHAGREVMQSLCDRNPGLAGRLRRMQVSRVENQAAALAGQPGSTQHVLKDAYRMQMARSLLAIDQNSCVRCGHCAWACAEVHDGVTRLVRSGDKILVPSATSSVPELASLLLPNTCQHCSQPACTIDCPTGAIGRDLDGEVFVREEICTGCGACAKACPWHNIQMAPRPARPKTRAAAAGSGSGLSALVAVKCDLCREYEAPACVAACPTDAVRRLDPREHFDAVRAAFGRGRNRAPDARGRAARSTPAWLFSGGAGVFGIGVIWLAQKARASGLEIALPTGVLALWGSLVLAGYAFGKRGLRHWLGRRRQGRDRVLGQGTAATAARSRVKPWLRLHQSVGLVTLAAVYAHSGFRFDSELSGLLLGTFLLLALSGVLGGLLYRIVPARLTRLEWRGSLPEEFESERAGLSDRLYQLTSGSDPLLKKVTERLLLPYSRSAWASIAWLCSGRDVAAERARLLALVETRLEGRGAERLYGLDELVKVVVDLRALPLRRALGVLLGFWLPWHAAGSLTLLVLLLLHVFAEVGR